MERTFHPVGQGAFYSEQLHIGGDKVFNVVYDCGSLSKDYNAILADCIQDYNQDNNNDIDILFISHFHDDHINGIAELSKNRNIKNVVIPYLDNIDKLIYIASLSNIAINSDALKIIYTPDEFFRESKIVTVLPAQGDDREIEQENFYYDTEDFGRIRNTINSKSIISIKNIENKDCDWLYIPTCVKSDDKKEAFAKALIDAKIITDKEGGISIDDIVYRRKTIKECYDKVFNRKHINNTSLMLYSGCTCHLHCCDPHYISFHQYNIRDVFVNNYPCGCLYLGDIHLNNCNFILKYYSQYIDSIGIVQVPHHGSTTSLNNDFWKVFHGRIGVISYGITHKYKHPHKDLLVELLNNRININAVTEDQKSRLICHNKCFF